MSSGGLMQLVAYGAQDMYLTGSNRVFDNQNLYLHRIREQKNKNKKSTIVLKTKKFINFQKDDKYDQRKCPNPSVKYILYVE
jgi:hypothetical protein